MNANSSENPEAATYSPAEHYDRVTSAWGLLLGEELHYGVFRDDTGSLADATGELTRLMIEAARLEEGLEVLDVGCGTGAPACRMARELGVKVTGITTSEEGIRAARRRAGAEGLEDRVVFELRDGMSNGFPDASFDRVWVLESSHLMRERDALVAECSRVLRPGGRMALCDIVLMRDMPLREVITLREPLTLLRDVFGDARMEPMSTYRELAERSGLVVDYDLDLTADTRSTFDAWRDNAERHEREVVDLIGSDGHRRFAESCDVLARFWDDGTLGYGLLAAYKP